MEGCLVGIEVNYVRVGLRNDLEKGGLWSKLEEDGNKLIWKGAEALRPDL